MMKEINLKNYKVKELSKIVYQRGTNYLVLSNELQLVFSPTGMTLVKNNKNLLTNKKDIQKYLKENNIKILI